MTYPTDLLYTEEHEWLRLDGDEGTVGITTFATQQLGDVVYVELPEVGRVLSEHEAFGVIESVKAVYDLFAPASGEVVARNEAILDAPELVNQAPFDRGWMIRLRLTRRDELERLQTPEQYEAGLAGQ